MTLREIAYIQIGGFTIIAILGMITISCLFITAIIGYLVTKGKAKMNLHKIFAIITLIIALIHGSIVLGSRFL